MEKAWSLALWSVLVCYNTGYRVGKLMGLPSRRKGIMGMARYHYTRENENGVVLYLESEPAEDAMDVSDDAIAVGFSGNGYLSFWTRCRSASAALRHLVLNWKSNQMEEETIATFYRHYDGYPSCHAIDIANSLVVASRTKPEQHIDFSGASVERDILNNRNWCQHFLKAMCMADADIEFIGEDNVPSASYTYVVTGAYDNFGGKVGIGAEEYLSRINIKVYEGDENGNLVFEGGAAECLAWADGYCGDC